MGASLSATLELYTLQRTISRKVAAQTTRLLFCDAGTWSCYCSRASVWTRPDKEGGQEWRGIDAAALFGKDT